MAERGREGDRGDVALVVGGGGFGALWQEMRARANPPSRLDRLEPDQSRARGIGEGGACCHEAADEILLGREHLAHAKIMRRGLAVQLAASGVTLLDAEHA